MAVLALAAVGGALGAATLGTLTIGSMAISGASIGWLAGSLIGNALFNKPPDQQGPRITDTKTDAGAYGQPIHQLWGRGVLTGETIWLSDLKESAHVEDAGGKGGGATFTTYTYSCDMLLRFCKSPTAGKNFHVRRIWANSILIYDSATVKKVDDRYIKLADLKIYDGDDAQLPDPTYEAAVGAGNAPAHIGYVTVSLTGLQLSESFGNRPPVIKAECYSDAVAGSGGATVTTYPIPAGYTYGVWGAIDPATSDLLLHAQSSGPYALHILRVNESTGAYISQFTGVPSTISNYLGYGTLPNTYDRPVAFDTTGGVIYGLDDGAYELLEFDVTGSNYLGKLNGAGTDYLELLVNPFDGFLWVARDSDASTVILKRINPITGGIANTIAFANSDFKRGTAFSGALKAWQIGSDGAGAWNLYEIDLLAPTVTLADSFAEAWDIVGFNAGKLWLTNVGAGRFGQYDIASNALTAWTLADASLSGASFYMWPSVTNGLLYYSLTAGATRDLVAWDIATQTVLHRHALTSGDWIGWADTSSAIGYFDLNGTNVLRFEPIAGAPSAIPYPLSEIILDVSAQANLSPAQIDVTDCTSILVDGYTSSGISTGRAMLEQLLMVYVVDGYRSGYKAKFRQRASAPVMTLSDDDWIASESDLSQFEISSHLELPRTLTLAYPDGDSGEYGVATQTASRQAVDVVGSMSIQTAVVLTAPQATALAWKILFSAWAESTLYRRQVSQRRSDLEPGDVILMRVGGQLRQARIQKAVDAGVRRELELVSVAHDGYTQAETGAGRLTVPALALGGLLPASPVVMDLPPLRAEDAGLFVYVAAQVQGGTTWGGGLLQKSRDGVNWTDAGLINFPAAHGVFTSSLPRPINYGNETGTDRSGSINLLLDRGSIFSITEDQVRQGGNVAFVGGQVIQFAGAALIGPGEYELSSIERNRLQLDEPTIGAFDNLTSGTEVLMMSRGGVLAIPMSRDEVDTVVHFRLVTSQQPVDDAVPVTLFFKGRSVRPRSPTYVQASRSGGDLNLSWLARNLAGFTWQDGADQALDNPSKYRVTIWNAIRTVVIRTIDVTTNSATYSNGDQVIDFGAPQATVQVSIQQFSSYFNSYTHSDEFRGAF